MADRAARPLGEDVNDDLSDLVTIPVAAREIHMSRPNTKALAIRHRIAIRWGGTDRFPRLKVRLSDLRQAVLREKFVPKGKPGHRQHPSNRALHPLVKC